MPSDDTITNQPTKMRAIVDALAVKGTHAALKPYLAKARWICQSIHPYMDLTRALYAGVPDAQDDEEEADYSDEERWVFSEIMKLQKGFKKLVRGCSEDPAAFLTLIGLLTSAGGASRSTDTSTLKIRITTLMIKNPNARPRKDQEQVPLIQDDEKQLRGWRHIDSARLLCPLRYRIRFDQDPFAFMDDVTNGHISFTADDLPSFLYPDEQPYNQEKEYLGLFQGHVVERSFRAIFTGPSTALDQSQRVPKCKARLFGLTAATPRTIAYAALQAYVALSSMSQWGPVDGTFDLNDFYDNLVGVFEANLGSRWAKETLEWMSNRAPGLRTKTTGKKAKQAHIQGQRTGPSAAQRIAAQLATQGNHVAPPSLVTVHNERGGQSQTPTESWEHEDPANEGEDDNEEEDNNEEEEDLQDIGNSEDDLEKMPPIQATQQEPMRREVTQPQASGSKGQVVHPRPTPTFLMSHKRTLADTVFGASDSDITGEEEEVEEPRHAPIKRRRSTRIAASGNPKPNPATTTKTRQTRTKKTRA